MKKLQDRLEKKKQETERCKELRMMLYSDMKEGIVSKEDYVELHAAAFKEAKETKGMPTAIIAKTIKGKGVSFMEDQAGWHGKAPNDEEYKIAMEDLEKAGEALCQK